jgi:hypothetical protein
MVLQKHTPLTVVLALRFGSIRVRFFKVKLANRARKKEAPANVNA